MGQEFDTQYWDEHWRATADDGPPVEGPHPVLVDEVGGLAPGTALEAGSGEGAESLWLAARGWDVTAVDASPAVLARAAARDPGGRVAWVEADLTTWEPDHLFDLVTTHYVHPASAPTAFYARLSGWVAPGGTLLVVAHRGGHDAVDHRGPHGVHTGRGPSGGQGGRGAPGGHEAHGHPPAAACVALTDVTAALDPEVWSVVTAAEPDRKLSRHGHDVVLRDVVVRAIRNHPVEHHRSEP